MLSSGGGGGGGEGAVKYGNEMKELMFFNYGAHHSTSQIRYDSSWVDLTWPFLQISQSCIQESKMRVLHVYITHLLRVRGINKKMSAGKQSTISPEERKWVKLTMASLLSANDLNTPFPWRLLPSHQDVLVNNDLYVDLQHSEEAFPQKKKV